MEARKQTKVPESEPLVSKRACRAAGKAGGRLDRADAKSENDRQLAADILTSVIMSNVPRQRNTRGRRYFFAFSRLGPSPQGLRSEKCAEPPASADGPFILSIA